MTKQVLSSVQAISEPPEGVLDRRAVQERISGAHATFNSCGDT